MPINVIRQIQQVLRARRTLENDNDLALVRPEGIRIEDVAAFLGQDSSHVADLLAMAETPKSLDLSVDRGAGDQTMGDALVDELTPDPADLALEHEVELLLEDWMAALSAREREVLGFGPNSMNLVGV